MVATGTPVIFIHGLWLHASSWDSWLKLFRRSGYEPAAPGWPAEPPVIQEARLLPEQVAGKGIDDVTDHYARIIRTLSAKPIVIGHSFGGLIAQKLLGDDMAVAAVAIDAAQPKGVFLVPFVQLKTVFPIVINPTNINRAIALSAAEFRYGFGNMLSAEESTELYTRWSIPSPVRPLFTVAAANLNPHSPAKVNTANADRGPLLLLGGGRDHTVPASVTRATYRLYNASPAITDIQEFADRGHSLVLDNGWREIADYVLAWLKEHSL